MDGSELAVGSAAFDAAGEPDDPAPTDTRPVLRPAGGQGIDQILIAARSRLRRLTPEAALLAQRAGAVLVDIRSEAQRAATGEIPGAVVVERTVLEWRLDPRSDSRLPIGGYDLYAVVVCQQGYSSSLAAASLQDVGLHRATDMIGGFDAWRAANLPVVVVPGG